jgi:hypothetical protein
MADRNVCSVEECEAPVRSNDYCYAHYMKAWRYGTPTPQHPPRWTDLRGQRFGGLVVEGRVKGAWACRCDCGAETVVRAGDLNRGTAMSCGDSSHRYQETVGYTAMHQRVRSERGKASTYPCVDCGGQAAHWSYDHLDQDQQVEDKEGQALPYSLDVNHYEPRCVPCHKRYDQH